jgi:hypothetical protein
MAEPVRAKDVQVAHIYQARCRVDGCNWSGDLVGSYQEANSERQAHLDEHRTLLINILAGDGG